MMLIFLMRGVIYQVTTGYLWANSVVCIYEEGTDDPRKHEVLQIELGSIHVIKPIPKYYVHF